MTTQAVTLVTKTDIIELTRVSDQIQLSINGQKSYLRRDQAHMIHLYIEQYLKKTK